MRACRFPLELPVRYRHAGDTTWIDGRTENISRSGVLFRTPEALAVDERIEIKIALSLATPVSPASDLLCDARVVRTERRMTSPTQAIAATFSRYRFVPAARNLH